MHESIHRAAHGVRSITAERQNSATAMNTPTMTPVYGRMVLAIIATLFVVDLRAETNWDNWKDVQARGQIF